MEQSGSNSNPWDPYRWVVEDALAGCTHHVRRLNRSLDGEIASDRRHFHDKALALKEFASFLVDRCEEVEGWITENAGKSRSGVTT